MFYIVLILLLEVSTIKICNTINGNFFKDMIIQLNKMGYKIKQEEQNNYMPRINELMSTLNGQKLVTMLLRIVPGINIISEYLVTKKLKELVRNDKIIKSYIEPMTTRENIEYDSLDNDGKRLLYANYLLKKKNDTQILVGFDGDIPIIADQALTSLINDMLEPLAYKYDEILKLADVTKENFVIGKAGNVNIAILGYPNNLPTITKVAYKRENFDVEHNFISMSEEEARAKGMTFIVYPYYLDKELEKKYDECIHGIQEERDKKNRIISDKTLFNNIDRVVVPMPTTNIYKVNKKK